jgi:hypothetical protein
MAMERGKGENPRSGQLNPLAALLLIKQRILDISRILCSNSHYFSIVEFAISINCSTVNVPEDSL